MTDLLILADRVEGLLPCPFCGGEAASCPPMISGDQAPAVAVCLMEGCGAEITAATEAEAIALWNTRSPDLRTIAANQENPDA